MHIRFIAIALFLLFGSVILFSQTNDSTAVCACGDDDLNPAGIMIGHEHPKGMWKVSYRYTSMMMKGNLSQMNSVNDTTVFNDYLMSSKNMRMDMHMLMAMYGITDKLSVMSMFNYNVTTMNMNMFGTAHMHTSSPVSSSSKMDMNTSGLGDIQVYAVYEALKKNNHSLFLSAGVNLPAGSIYAKGKSTDMMYPSQRLPYMMQLGSGTVDFMPGFTYLLKYNSLSLGAQATSVLRPFNNVLNYHLGNQLTINGWLAYKWLNWVSTSARVDDNYIWVIKGKDAQLSQTMEPSADPFNYGGQTINCYGGFNFYFNRSFLSNSKLSVEYGVPVYQFVNGIQPALKSIVNASWVFSF